MNKLEQNSHVERVML